MAFNVRLAFARTNVHDAHLYKGYMNIRVVKIEVHPMAFDLLPWVNYQGDSYMGQGTKLSMNQTMWIKEE